MPQPDVRRRSAGRPAVPGQVRRALLDAAVELVFWQGVKGTGVKQIVAQANTTAQALYTNFGSKADLVSAAVEEWAASWRQELQLRLLGVDRADRLLAVFDLVERWLVQHQFRGSMVINTGLELTNPDDPAFKVIQVHRQAMLAILGGYATLAGLADPSGVAQTWLVLLDGAITAAVQEASGNPVRVVRGIAEQLLTSNQR